MKLRNKLWLWGQTPNSHHSCGNPFHLPGENKMTPREGCDFFGISNVFRVVMADMPAVSEFDREAAALADVDKLVWSVLGSGASAHAPATDEILRLADKYPNIVGGITDDFLNETRMKLFTPEMIATHRQRLHAFEKRKLDLYTVVYVRELTEERRSRLAEFDTYSMWTWHGSDIPLLEENYAKLRALVGTEKKILAGCYMWNYGEMCEMTDAYMAQQLEVYYRWLCEGKVDGMVLCSNCIADLGIHAVDMLQEWLALHGDEELN